MSENPTPEQREYDITIHVFSISAGLVGVCLTGIGLLRVVISNTKVGTVGDDLLAVDAMMFMLTCLISFWSFKTRLPRRRRMLRYIVDTLFMVALGLMVVICGLIAYEFI